MASHRALPSSAALQLSIEPPIAALLLLALQVVTPPAIAQEWAWDWVASPEGNTCVRGTALNADGGLVAVGEFGPELTLGDITLTTQGSSDIFVIKLDAAGQLLWAESFGGEWLDRAFGVAVDPAGNVLVAGEFISNAVTFADTTLYNTVQVTDPMYSTSDVFTLKLAPDGTVLWAAQGGGIYDDHAQDVATDGDGFVIAVGTFVSPTICFAGNCLTNAGNYDAFLARYDSAGGVCWVRAIAGTGQENAWQVRAGSGGEIHVSGSFRSPLLAYENLSLTNSSDDFDLYILKCGPRGNGLWLRGAHGEEWDDAEALALDSSDNVYVSGHYESDSLCFDTDTLWLSESSSVNIDMYLVKLGAGGDLLWARSSTGGAWPDPADMAVDRTDGMIAVAGTFNGLSGGHSESFDEHIIDPIHSYDIFLAHFAPDGHALHAEVIGGDEMDFAQSVECDQGATTLAAFFGSSSVAVGDTVLVNSWSNRSFIARQSVVGGDVPGPPADTSIGLTLLPISNPASAQVSIAFRIERSALTRLEIFDAAGRCVDRLVDRVLDPGSHRFEWEATENATSVARARPSGVYFCRLRSGASTARRSFCLVR
jgi:DNA-binding beta-propeller fold protein YncE